MSRSRRKPYWVDGYGTKRKGEAKQRASAKVRKDPDVSSGNAYRKVSNPWDICDYKFYDPKSAKVRRK